MVEKSMVSAKIAERTKDRLDEYAEKEGISRSQAIGRMLKQGLDVEESDMRLVPVQTDGGTKLENQIGEVQQRIEQQSESYEQKLQVQKYQMLLIALSLFWISLHLVFDVGGLVTVLTGVPVALGLLYVTFVWGDNNESE
jgi:hypothetical protein